MEKKKRLIWKLHRSLGISDHKLIPEGNPWSRQTLIASKRWSDMCLKERGSRVIHPAEVRTSSSSTHFAQLVDLNVTQFSARNVIHPPNSTCDPHLVWLLHMLLWEYLVEFHGCEGLSVVPRSRMRESKVATCHTEGTHILPPSTSILSHVESSPSTCTTCRSHFFFLPPFDLRLSVFHLDCDTNSKFIWFRSY